MLHRDQYAILRKSHLHVHIHVELDSYKLDMHVVEGGYRADYYQALI
jgi:hypothetical protein